MANFKISLEKAKAHMKELQGQNDGTRRLLAGAVEELFRRPPSEDVIANFKEGQNYKDILVDDAVSIMKTYSLKISENFDDVHSIFPEFVEENFEKEYGIPLVDLEESDNDPSDDESDVDLGED
ncbi:hypothetical protein LIER_41636 [Lithospermum erythrorhizon]|uniref:Uncharacterized protein n=1 Tax=Lithospermum erythrorhizon TaxID=34254 RepID=A0AAV3RCH7_LITER